jgi:hypothetical protein
MLRAKVLPKVLEQALTNGIETAALLDLDGSLLACAGDDGRVVAAIFANIWSSFQDVNALEYILCELEVRFSSLFSRPQNGRVCLTRVTPTILLLVYGDSEAQFGMLKHKVVVASLTLILFRPLCFEVTLKSR